MNALQKIRMGLLLANIKLGRVCTHDESYPKDPNPENWRTINGSKVHLTNGKIDGGASGKFVGKNWTGQKAHGSNSFFPRFNYQQNLFGGQEIMPSRTMQKETNRQNRIARRAQRRNERNEANKAAGLARQAEVREYALNTMREFTNEVKSDPSAAKRAKQFLEHKKNAKYKETKEYKDLENAVKTSEDPKMNKNHPYWKTPEGKAQSYFDNMMLESRAWTQSSAKKTEHMAELARERLLKLNSAAAGINQKIDRLNQKRTLTKEDEKELTRLRKQRQEAEHEANAFASAWQKWKAENNIQENVTTERKRLENGMLQTTRKVEVSQPQEKTYSALEAVAELRKRAKARKAEATPKAEKPKSTTPRKKGTMKSRLWDNAKEAGIDLDAFHVGGGKWDKRNNVHIDLEKMPKEQQAAFTQMAKEKGYTLSWNGGLGYAVKEVAAPKPQRALKAAEKTPPPEGYEEYLQRKKSGELNSYEAQQEARRERFEGRSAAAAAESQQRSQAARKIMSAIPMGQPILVGHHSEQRHRSDLNKVDNNMRKSWEAQEKANYYAGRAESVGTGGISSVDPDAKFKVYEKLSTLEEARERMKLANHIYNSHSNEADRLAAYKEAGFSDKLIGIIQRNSGGNKEPFYNYQISNNNAEIRRLKQRLEDLSKSASTEGQSIESNTLYDLKQEDGRYQFKFDGKPSDEVRSILKSHGFKWSPSRGTWVRSAAGNGSYAMKQVQKELEPHIVIPF
jgi:hypothetical protein